MAQEMAQEKEQWKQEQEQWKSGLNERDHHISKLQQEQQIAIREREANHERMIELTRKLDKEQQDRRKNLENLKQTMDQE